MGRGTPRWLAREVEVADDLSRRILGGSPALGAWQTFHGLTRVSFARTRSTAHLSAPQEADGTVRMISPCERRTLERAVGENPLHVFPHSRTVATPERYPAYSARSKVRKKKHPRWQARAAIGFTLGAGKVLPACCLTEKDHEGAKALPLPTSTIPSRFGLNPARPISRITSMAAPARRRVALDA